MINDLLEKANKVLAQIREAITTIESSSSPPGEGTILRIPKNRYATLIKLSTTKLPYPQEFKHNGYAQRTQIRRAQWWLRWSIDPHNDPEPELVKSEEWREIVKKYQKIFYVKKDGSDEYEVYFPSFRSLSKS